MADGSAYSGDTSPGADRIVRLQFPRLILFLSDQNLINIGPRIDRNGFQLSSILRRHHP
jgi:hypothetical protein